MATKDELIRKAPKMGANKILRLIIDHELHPLTSGLGFSNWNIVDNDRDQFFEQLLSAWKNNT